MHDVTILRVAPQDIRDNLTESLWIESLVNVLDGCVDIFLCGTDATLHIAVITHNSLLVQFLLKRTLLA
jgi:hypothetical protein